MGPYAGTAACTPVARGGLSLLGEACESQLFLLPARAPSHSCPMAAAGNVSSGRWLLGHGARRPGSGLHPGPLKGGQHEGMVPRESRPLCATLSWTLSSKASPGLPRKPESQEARQSSACLRAAEVGCLGRGEEAVRGSERALDGGDPPSLCPLSPGLPRNETRVPCSTVPVVREISHNGCAKLVTMNDCFGSCGTFAT